MSSSVTPYLSIRLGVQVEPDPSVSVEEVLLAVGDQVSPLAAPSTRVTVSGVPPFISNEAPELQHFGKMVSGLRTVGLGQRFSNRNYMVYASSGRTRCFECVDVGHKRVACPHTPANEGAHIGAMSSHFAPQSGGGDEVVADAGGGTSGQVGGQRGAGECLAAFRAGREGAVEEVQIGMSVETGAAEEVQMGVNVQAGAVEEVQTGVTEEVQMGVNVQTGGADRSGGGQ
ncbi:hypothetical protein D4764_12G0007730 [Takifugu flavidus]|uniref:CCHC-type domain-containing protein n=1 Tax=Takifugu flavidus TaxID=433684 RepID=A0A5C6PD58_9TELE|nr:hypothetical protein D4764_12G0007730 [Takifugu flavidus]